jgi:hypothetical protein
MTVNTRIIKLFLSHHISDYVPLPEGKRLQVLPSMSYLPRCQKHHFGAFIQDQQLLVVWDDEPKNLLARAEGIEKSLMTMIWEGTERMDQEMNEKKEPGNVSEVDLGYGTVDAAALEEALITENRPTLLINPIMVGMTLTLLIAALGLGWRNLAQQVAVDGDMTRLALLAVTPAQIFVSLVSLSSMLSKWPS